MSSTSDTNLPPPADANIQLNAVTGRPVRKSTARKDLRELGYVNTEDVIDESEADSGADQGDLVTLSRSPADLRRFERRRALIDAEEEDSDDYETTLNKRKLAKAASSKSNKRARHGQPSRERSRTPPLSEFVPVRPPIPETPAVVGDRRELLTLKLPLEVRIHFPADEKVIRLWVNPGAAARKRGQVIQLNGPDIYTRQQQQQQPSLVVCPPALQEQAAYTDVSEPVRTVGFLDLPAELRNKIYRYVFMKGPVDFEHRTNLCRSGALLSTCRQVLVEGRTVLYGENRFLFNRIRATRGHYFQRIWEEIAYQDMYRFLNDIGRDNISLISHMTIQMHDGYLSDNRERTREERRFVHDVYLRQSLKLLGQYHGLKTLRIAMHGMKTISFKNHYGFLHLLQGIRGLEQLEFFVVWGHDRIKDLVMTQCLNVMVKPEHRQKHSNRLDAHRDLLGRCITFDAAYRRQTV